jgi:hypothetical protein
MHAELFLMSGWEVDGSNFGAEPSDFVIRE